MKELPDIKHEESFGENMSDHFGMKEEIKKEPSDNGEFKDHDFDNESFKDKINHSQNYIDDKFSFEADNGNMDMKEDKPHKRKKSKKKSLPLTDGMPTPSDDLLENYYDFELSVEFLSQLFQYVNELCEYINDGDQNVSRSSIVIQNLNDSVKPYRVNLPDPKEVVKETEDQEDFKENFKYEMEMPDYCQG